MARYRWRSLIWGGIFLGVSLFMGGANGGGCGGKSVFDSLSSDSTTEAKIEKAKIALDDGDYAAAVNTLQDLCGTNLSAPTCSSDLVGLYASAFSGRAGLDFFTLIKDAANQTASSGATSYALFSKTFASPTVANADDMNSSVILLSSITTRTPDQGLQMAVDATVDLVMFLGTLSGGYDANGKPISIPSVSAITPANVNRVLSDINSMNTGVLEAAISNENIAGHVAQIQAQLSNPDSTKIVNFLGSI